MLGHEACGVGVRCAEGCEDAGVEGCGKVMRCGFALLHSYMDGCFRGLRMSHIIHRVPISGFMYESTH